MTIPMISDVKPVVVIPTHRSNPTSDEQFGLRRCSVILSSHPIFFVHPEGLDISAYSKLIPTASFKSVPPGWMSSYRNYNRMILNPAFYSLFSAYTHLLLHEPDALVFRDELIAWCCHSYDFIGAVFFEGYQYATKKSRIIGVGNSGFSLIKISSMQQFLTSSCRWVERRWLLKQLVRAAIGRQTKYSSIQMIKLLGSLGSMKYAHHLVTDNCDYFIFKYARYAVSGFLIAPVHDALSFSWEVNPRICHDLNLGALPFGAHAWARYDRSYILGLIERLSANMI